MENGELLELAHGFIIDGVAFFKRHDGRKDGTCNDVDSNDHNSCADNHSLLGGVVFEPLFAVQIGVSHLKANITRLSTFLFGELSKFNLSGRE